MRKRGLAILLCTASLSFGAAITAYAEGWVQSGNNYIYQDSNGNKVTNEWRKGGDNQWRYLDSSGYMALNCWVDDDTYYVDNNGIMATDKWLKVSVDDFGEYDWYYLGSSGKKITDAWKKISDKYYYFDDDGIMKTGWFEDGDNMYYLGSDGAMRTGWQNVVPNEDEDDDDGYGPMFDEEDGEKKWFYFDSKGKLYQPDDEYDEKRVNNIWYCFDNTGAMQTGWVALDGNESDIAGYKYYNDSGVRQTGWQLLYPPEEVDGSSYDEEQYFYFENDGSPKVGPLEGTGTEADLVRISGITYMFNEMGNPIQGLQRITSKDGSDYYAYYFGDKATSSVVTGKETIEEGDGTDSTFYFAESGTYKGRGYTGVRDNYLYYKGKLQKADSSMRYEAFSIPNGSKYTTYVVNSSGKVQKNRSVKDSDGNKFKTNSSGALVELNDETFSGTNYRQPVEPVFMDE